LSSTLVSRAALARPAAAPGQQRQGPERRQDRQGGQGGQQRRLHGLFAVAGGDPVAGRDLQCGDRGPDTVHRGLVRPGTDQGDGGVQSLIAARADDLAGKGALGRDQRGQRLRARPGLADRRGLLVQGGFRRVIGFQIRWRTRQDEATLAGFQIL